MDKRYQVVYDTEHFTGDCGLFETLEEGLDAAIEVLKGWMTDEIDYWKIENGIFKPTEKQIKNWNYMIDTCEAYVVDLRYDGNNPEEKETETYYCIDGHYYPSLKIAESLGWKYWES